MRVLVTGAGGFIGRFVCSELVFSTEVVGALRSPAPAGCLHPGISALTVGDIHGETSWVPFLEGIEVVVHLAARVHVLRDSFRDPWPLFRRVNTEGTIRLAEECAKAGVRRIVFVSTIGVTGNRSPIGPDGRPVAIRGDEPPCPADPYARSKWEAEAGLREVATAKRMEYVIIRPPLVYGPGMKGNMVRLLDWIWSDRPLPFGSVRNQRSFLGVQNLANLIHQCVRDARAAGGTVVASDEDTISTPDLIRRLAFHTGRRACLWRVPVPLVKTGGAILGKTREFSRLLDSLVVDNTPVKRRLNWAPSITLEEGLRGACRSYRAEKSGEDLESESDCE